MNIFVLLTFMAMWSIVVCAEDAAPAKIEEKPKGYVGITVENSGLKIIPKEESGKRLHPSKVKREYADDDDTFLEDVLTFSLTDNTFEALTQATTGGTTGAWFVEFMAPWCEHCQEMNREFNELAHNVQGDVNVAKVDCDKNYLTALRFNITEYPTLVFLKGGMAYEFKGYRTATIMEKFVRSGYSLPGASFGLPIPKRLGTFDVLVEHGRRYPFKLYALASRKPLQFFASIVVGSAFGFVPLLVFLYASNGSGVTVQDVVESTPSSKDERSKSKSKHKKSTENENAQKTDDETSTTVKSKKDKKNE